MAVAEERVTSSVAERSEDAAELYLKIRSAEAKLVGSNGRARVLPVDLAAFLREVLGDLQAGQSVTILRDNEALTTVEAAGLLSVSRAFLIQLLEQGQMPFHKVGTHRRVYARDVLAYKAKRDAERRQILNDLVRAEMEEGIYDLVPLHVAES
jgi:excisionase family DNA binding protein